MTKPTLCVLLLAALLNSPIPLAPARADLGARVVPEFTDEEQIVIARNATLRMLVNEDPWTVKTFLKKLDALNEQASDEDGVTSENPDIDRLSRSSPEGAHDLLQIIKEAGSGSTGTSKTREPRDEEK